MKRSEIILIFGKIIEKLSSQKRLYEVLSKSEEMGAALR